MLNPFCIRFGCGRRNPQRLEKCGHRLVTGLGRDGKFTPGFRKKYRPIGLGGYELIPLEAFDRSDDGDVRHAKHFGQIGSSRFATGRDQFSNRLHIVLRPFLGVLLSRPFLIDGRSHDRTARG